MSNEIERVEMPKSDYVSFCDTIREKTGSTEPIKSSELVEKTETVYQTGYEQGKSEGGTSKEEQEKTVDITENGTVPVVPDEGKTLSKVVVNVNVPSSDIYYDAFWDANQQNGNRIHYGSAYASPTSGMFIWTDENFVPKYDMHPTSINAMFQYSDIENIKGIFEHLGRIFDTSDCTDTAQAFRGSGVVYPPELDLSRAPHLNATFNSCKKVKSIVLKNVQSTMTYANNPFRDCEQLTDLTIEGTIGNTVDFGDSPLLTVSSIDSVGNAVADLTGKNSQTVTFNKAVIEKMSDEQKAVFTNKNWTIVSKG